MAFSWKLEGRIFSHQLKAPGFVLWGSSGTRKTLIQMGESDKISPVYSHCLCTGNGSGEQRGDGTEQLSTAGIRAAGWGSRAVQAAPFPAGQRWAFPPPNTPESHAGGSQPTQRARARSCAARWSGGRKAWITHPKPKHAKKSPVPAQQVWKDTGEGIGRQGG